MSIFNDLTTQFPTIPWEQNVLLAPYTYMKIGGPAEVFWRATSIDAFAQVVRYCKSIAGFPLTVLGGSSNVVIADKGVSGLVIVNECSQAAVLEFQEVSSLVPFAAALDQKAGWFLAESGIKTALLVRQTVDAGLTGLEPFLGVPGTLGGAIYNNSHYTHELIGNWVAAVEVITSEGVSWLSHDECAFAYDSSRFQESGEVIRRVLFALSPGTAEHSLEIIKEATIRRATTQPLGTANSGCVFKNAQLSPEQQTAYDGKETLSAGWLIDQAGLKGTRIGGAVISSKHANFIVNEGTATAEDVEALAQHIERSILEKFGLKLEREVFFLGKWKEKHAGL